MSRRPGKHARKSTVLSDPSLSADFDLSLAEAFEAATPSLLSIETLSTDRRRLYQHALPVPSPASRSQSPALSPSSTLPPSGIPQPQEWDPFFLPAEPDVEAVVDGEEDEPAVEGTWKAPRYETSVRPPPFWRVLEYADGLNFYQDEPLKQFIPKRQFFLDEMLRRDGRGDFVAEKCSACPDRSTAGPASIRCMSCIPGPLVCEACAVRGHCSAPYHRIKVCTSLVSRHFTSSVAV